MAVKTIVTNLTAFKSKYGEEQMPTITSAFLPLVASDRKRGIVTTVVDMSDRVQMAKLNAPVVTAPASAQQNKNAIDGVFAGTNPHYLTILGGPDIVPFQPLQNFAGDRDPDVPSDLPYACEAPYSTDPRDFLAPTRVVGRLPDVTGRVGAEEPGYIGRLVEWIVTLRPGQRTAYETYFSVTAQVWLESSQKSLNAMFGNAAALHVSPPEGPDWTQEQLAPKTAFVNCHGSSSSPTWVGQEGADYPPALTASGIARRITPGTIAAAECCYGAQLYAPPSRGALSICNTYLESGSVAFLGSTNIAYGASSERTAADLLTASHISGMLEGRSAGAALLAARQGYLRHTYPDPIVVKTVSQFILLGDPSVTPIEPAPRPALADADFLIAERRRQAELQGRLLGRGMAVPVPIAPEEARPSPALLALAEERGIAEPRVSSFRAEWRGEPELRPEGLEDGGPLIHLVRSAREDAPVPSALVLTAREIDGRIVSVEEAWEH